MLYFALIESKHVMLHKYVNKSNTCLLVLQAVPRKVWLWGTLLILHAVISPVLLIIDQNRVISPLFQLSKHGNCSILSSDRCD